MKKIISLSLIISITIFMINCNETPSNQMVKSSIGTIADSLPIRPRPKPKPKPRPKPIQKEKIEGEIFEEVDQEPLFPEKLEGVEDYKVQLDSSYVRLLRFVYRNTYYPVSFGRCIEGVVVIRFIVDKTGRVVNPKILRDLGCGTGDNALAMVKKMQQLPKWTPAIKDGKPVNFQYNLPVRYKMYD